MSKLLVQLVVLFLPWPLRRAVLCRLSGWKIDPTARIGISILLAERVELAQHARIGHLTVVKRLELIELREHATLGNFNLVTCFRQHGSSSFAHLHHRKAALIVGRHAAITMRHIIDCNQEISIGDFSTIAGYGSQLLTHSIDLYKGIQHAEPIHIGSYCFVGTSCVLLGGTVLPDFCVLGALSLLNKRLTDRFCLYAGTPAVLRKKLPSDAAYFTRQTGHVV